MGIPKLTQDLAPYAEFTTVGRGSDGHQSNLLTVEKWVIDGPSLIYHAYNDLLTSKVSLSASASGSLPTYQEVNGAVEAYLPTLEKHGIHLEAIFFDGGLPESKRNIRRERLEKARKQLEDARHETLGRRVSLPPLPFIVASAIESLQRSTWTDRVHVVPGEADVACAHYAAHTPASILSNDSDLALFPIRPESRIAWLYSLVKKSQKDGSTLVQASTLTPSAVAIRLGLPSLLQLGFERHRDPSVTARTVVDRARHALQSDAHSEEYAKFCEQYLVANDTASPLCLNGLDPRTAELIVQVQTSIRPLQVYFPILHEDPSRDAAWSYGAHIRQLAYSIFGRFCPRAYHEVTEYHRKGPRIAVSSVRILAEADVTVAVASLLDVLALIAEVSSDQHAASSGVMSWWCVALSILADSKSACGKLLDSSTVWALFGIGKQSAGKSEWDCIHLHANLQAVLYSLRMLKQIIDYLPRNERSIFDKPPDMLQLVGMLKDMPGIAALFLDVRQLRSLVAELGTEPLRAVLQSGEVPIGREVAKGHIGNKERAPSKRRKAKSAEMSHRGQKSQNAFNLLAHEDEDEDRDLSS